MKKIICVSVYFFVAPAHASLINFDSFTGMVNSPGTSIPTISQISDQFLVSDGVQFSSGENSFIAAVDLSPNGTTSLPNGVGGSNTAGQLTYSGNFFNATFFDPSNVSAFGITDIVSVRSDTIPAGSFLTFSAFDVNGNLLGSDTQVDTGGNLFLLSFSGIHSVSFFGSGTVALDDFSFNPVSSVPVPVPVPAPAAVWLMGSGLIGLVGMRKKSAKPSDNYA